MIIGISGKKQSGKNTLAEILNKISSGHSLTDSEKSFEFWEWETEKTKYELKSFAHKVKEIVSILTGISLEGLENRSIKEMELGKEWWVWKLERDGGYSTVLQPYENSENTENFELVKMTPRKLLQLVGTECGRNIIHPSIWINALLSKYNKDFSKWIVTDVRFKNEAEAVKSKGGILIRINRETGLSDNHPSETDLDEYPEWDFIIDNNGSMEDLTNSAKEAIIKLNL